MTEEHVTCPDCGGGGFTVVLIAVCCQRSDWECGARGCTGPEQGQEQEGCEMCRGEGVVPASAVQS